MYLLLVFIPMYLLIMSLLSKERYDLASTLNAIICSYGGFHMLLLRTDTINTDSCDSFDVESGVAMASSFVGYLVGDTLIRTIRKDLFIRTDMIAHHLVCIAYSTWCIYSRSNCYTIGMLGIFEVSTIPLSLRTILKPESRSLCNKLFGVSFLIFRNVWGTYILKEVLTQTFTYDVNFYINHITVILSYTLNLFWLRKIINMAKKDC